jgi:hypothetical protein
MADWIITLLITLGANAIVWLVAMGRFLERQRTNDKRITENRLEGEKQLAVLEARFNNRAMLPECIKVINNNLIQEAGFVASVREALARVETKVDLIVGDKIKPAWNGTTERRITK